MSKKDLILIGGGGHCKSCIDVIETEGKYNIVGIIDKQEKINQEVLGYKIIGSDEDISYLAQKYSHFFITVGQIESESIRLKLYEKLTSLGVNLPTIKSPYSVVSKYAEIGKGTIIMHNCIVNAGAKIGNNCIINTKTLIEHDTLIEDNCHIATGVTINGNCFVGKNSFLGSGSIIVQGTIIKNNSFIKASSLVYEK